MSETAERVFAEGIRTFNKSNKQPGFVVGTVIIEPNTLFKWLKANEDLLEDYNGQKQLKLQAVHSKDGKFLIKLDTFKPDPNYKGTTTTTKKEEGEEDDLLF